MTRRLSIRRRLVLSTFAATLGIACPLVVALHARTGSHLLEHLEKTLGTKCDEVISVLREGRPELTLKALLRIETSYRNSPDTYFYQIVDRDGRIQAKSDNLGDAALPIPTDLAAPSGPAVTLTDAPYPGATRPGATIRVRSERVLASGAGAGHDLLIQVGVTLEALHATMRRHFVHTVLQAAAGLLGVLVLLWFVTARSLRPVALMTRQASRMAAGSPRERLPLQGTADELDQLATVLNGMLDGLQQSLDQMERFTSDAAHQLRTPLTRIRGELDLMLRDGVPAPLRGQLERMQEELERLSRVCGRLLLLARLDHETQAGSTLFADRVQLDEVVSELTEELAPLARDKGVSLCRGPVVPAEVRGSRPLLVEALLNLLHNALRFTAPGGLVEVSLATADGNTTVAVRDSGPGIPSEEQERIFHRFYKIAAGPGDAEGTGLGLAIVKAIARAHGGGVDVVSTPGAGSCFRLTFPRARRFAAAS